MIAGEISHGFLDVVGATYFDQVIGIAAQAAFGTPATIADGLPRQAWCDAVGNS